MTHSARFRYATFLLLLIFPAQLLALVYLPCLHAAGSDAGPLPPCHLGSASRVEQSASQYSTLERAAAVPDCGKCQMQTAFSAMSGSDAAGARATLPAVVERLASLRYFYNLYPDPLKRPPRRPA